MPAADGVALALFALLLAVGAAAGLALWVRSVASQVTPSTQGTQGTQDTPADSERNAPQRSGVV